MNFCPKCRKKLVVQDFCVECGADLSEYLNGAPNADSSFDTFDFSVLQNANEQLIEQSGLVIENGVLTGYTGKKTSVYIPSSVEEIFDKAFYSNDFITDVEIADGATVIGKSAFANCRYLKGIKIPKSVKQIGEYAFYSTSLDELLLDEYNETYIKACLSANAINCVNMGLNLRDFVRNENGSVIVNIKAIEAKAVEYINEYRRKEEERQALLRKEAEKKIILESWKIGGYPKFGTYYYRNTHEKFPIEWYVLAREGSKALIISRYVIDSEKYHNESTDITWENSTIRKWLNNEFINTAFSNNEREKIQTTYVLNPNNSAKGTVGGNSTYDKIFLLSTDEARKYFRSDSERIGKPTPYCMRKCYASNGNVTWWLRSPGFVQFRAGHISYDGSIADGLAVAADGYGVRPVIWVDADKIIAELQ